MVCLQAAHLQRRLEAKQLESQHMKSAIGVLKAEMAGLQTALAASKELAEAAMSQHSPQEAPAGPAKPLSHKMGDPAHSTAAAEYVMVRKAVPPPPGALLEHTALTVYPSAAAYGRSADDNTSLSRPMTAPATRQPMHPPKQPVRIRVCICIRRLLMQDR
jgi:hypothetical protein